MPNGKKRLEDMIAERYQNPQVQEAILAEIAASGTADDIVSGKLTLPSEHDAIRHVSGVAFQENEFLKSQHGVSNKYDAEKHLEARIKHRDLTKEN